MLSFFQNFSFKKVKASMQGQEPYLEDEEDAFLNEKENGEKKHY